MKVKYAKSTFPVYRAPFIQLPKSIQLWKKLKEDFHNGIGRHGYFGMGQPAFQPGHDFIYALCDAKINEERWLEEWYDVYYNPDKVVWTDAEKNSYLKNIYWQVYNQAKLIANKAMHEAYVSSQTFRYFNTDGISVGMGGYPIFQVFSELMMYDPTLKGFDKSLLYSAFSALTSGSYLEQLHNSRTKDGIGVLIDRSDQIQNVRKGRRSIFNIDNPTPR